MNYLIVIVLFIISFILSFFYTNPLLTEITSLRAESASLDKSLAETKDLQKVTNDKEALYNNFTEDEKAKINKLLPDSIDNVKLVIDIDNIASKYNMKMRSIDLKMEKTGDINQQSNNPYGVATLRFSVSAPYERFRFFLNDIEDSLRLVDITSISFTAGDKDINEYNIELKTYWLKDTI